MESELNQICLETVGSVSYQNLGGVGAVDGDRVDEGVQRLCTEGAGVGDLFVMDVSHIALHHSHAVGGQGASLVGADGGGVTHGFTSIQVPHQVVVLHHFLSKHGDTFKDFMLLLINTILQRQNFSLLLWYKMKCTYKRQISFCILVFIFKWLNPLV